MGGTELAVQAQARGLAARGVDVAVAAGSVRWEGGFRTSTEEDRDPATGRAFPVHRIHRADLYFDHWQKSASPAVARAFRELLRAERPDVVHVQHWIRLTRDLVAVAAEEGIPAVVTLHDLWTTCLLSFRVQPGTAEACRERAGYSPCAACAGGLPPRTPWIAPEDARMAFAERAMEVTRELDLARAVIVPSAAHARAVERFLGRAAGALGGRVIPPGRDLALPRRAPLPPPREHGRLELGSWGHLHPLKGADVILEALRLPSPELGPVRLHLAGAEVDRAYAARLRELARGLDVVLHGPFAAEELATHPVTAVHALVSGSRAHESWGLVLDEAWALGLPAVLPDAGAFAERAGADGARGALLYDQGDARSLRGRLAALAREHAALAARVPAEPCPGVADTVALLVEAYEDALAAGPPRAPARDPLRELVRERSLEAWDAALAKRTPAELGFEEAP